MHSLGFCIGNWTHYGHANCNTMFLVTYFRVLCLQFAMRKKRYHRLRYILYRRHSTVVCSRRTVRLRSIPGVFGWHDVLSNYTSIQSSIFHRHCNW